MAEDVEMVCVLGDTFEDLDFTRFPWNCEHYFSEITKFRSFPTTAPSGRQKRKNFPTIPKRNRNNSLRRAGYTAARPVPIDILPSDSVDAVRQASIVRALSLPDSGEFGGLVFPVVRISRRLSYRQRLPTVQA